MGVLKHVLLVCVLKHVLKHDNLAGDQKKFRKNFGISFNFFLMRVL